VQVLAAMAVRSTVVSPATAVFEDDSTALRSQPCCADLSLVVCGLHVRSVLGSTDKS
jgi:hypothetical protein